MNRQSSTLLSIRAVFFDLGNVLCEFDWSRSVQRLAGRLPGVAAEDISSWLLSSRGPHDPFCRGEIDEVELFTRLHDRFDPDRQIPDAWLLHLWCDMFRPLDRSLEIVDALRGHCVLGLISNTNHLHFEYLDHHLGLRDRFQVVVLSYELGALKPDPQLFATALERARVRPEQAFFTDDHEEFTAAARAIGMHATTFVGADPLRAELLRLGLPL